MDCPDEGTGIVFVGELESPVEVTDGLTPSPVVRSGDDELLVGLRIGLVSPVVGCCSGVSDDDGLGAGGGGGAVVVGELGDEGEVDGVTGSTVVVGGEDVGGGFAEPPIQLSSPLCWTVKVGDCTRESRPPRRNVTLVPALTSASQSTELLEVESCSRRAPLGPLAEI